MSVELAKLKKHLEKAAFLIGKEDQKQAVHSEILQALYLVSDMESKMNSIENEQSIAKEKFEVEKVDRRLSLWAKRSSQVNTRILKAYLRLKRAGQRVISEEDLKREVNDPKFDSNFAQMKIIADKNHGKIFEQYGAKVTIWPPVQELVNKFENDVFTGHGEL
ncbi:hypothetical protein [Aliikangiella sp. IMCC44632]